MVRKLIVSCALAAGLAGCFKEVSMRTDVVLKPWVQAESNGELQGVEDPVAWAFEADTAQWTVASYADALAGRLTDKRTGAEGPRPVEGALMRIDSVEIDLVSMHVERSPVVLVAVDPVNRLYGYRQLELGENLSPLWVSVVFRPWRLMRKYVDGAWRMVNEFYEENDETTQP